MNERMPSSSPSSTLRRFSLAEIKAATNNFDPQRRLSRGWSSTVYKGSYEDYNGIPKTVAIKCFDFEPLPPGFFIWFENSLEMWSRFRHKHVVSVIGYCQEPPCSRHLVYEYMPNGSLANHLRKKITPVSFSLSWEQCIRACIDAARGLEYLHTLIYPNGNLFVHADITATNILLDDNGVAKISDLYYEPIETKQSMIAYTYDPEYHSTWSISQGSDVYAFGVLLVKLLPRVTMFHFEHKGSGMVLKEWIRNGVSRELVHPNIQAQISPDCLEAFLRIAGKCLREKSHKRPNFTQVVENLERLSASSSSPHRQQLCLPYSLHHVKDATNNFDHILGKGGEGMVYKGMMETSTAVAVKRLKPECSSEFHKEIKMLSNLDHPNLVSLVGYCHESDENILIYEFMGNGNLDHCLKNRCLSWKQRLDICIGAARGLSYLHRSTDGSPKGIVHRDVKPANILLDENFNAKISDFGLSKMGPKDQLNSEIVTGVKGTAGYYAPEYHRSGKITRRIDVYAFGVVLSEVLCRKKPWDRDGSSFYATEDEEYGKWAKINIDPHLKDMIAPVCLEAFTGILEKCVNLNPNKRPPMNDVVSVLEYASESQDAWERHKSNGDFSLPGCEDRVVFYFTSSSQEYDRNIKVRLILMEHVAHLDERDLGKDFHVKELKDVFGETVDTSMPQLFVRGKYIGNVNEVEKLSDTGELAKHLGVHPPKFICNICGEASKCRVCERTVWFVHCKNCDALANVLKRWKGELRSCLECNSRTLTCRAITERRQRNQFLPITRSIKETSRLYSLMRSAVSEEREKKFRSRVARGADFLASMFQ